MSVTVSSCLACCLEHEALRPRSCILASALVCRPGLTCLAVCCTGGLLFLRCAQCCVICCGPHPHTRCHLGSIIYFLATPSQVLGKAFGQLLTCGKGLQVQKATQRGRMSVSMRRQTVETGCVCVLLLLFCCVGSLLRARVLMLTCVCPSIANWALSLATRSSSACVLRSAILSSASCAQTAHIVL